MGETSQEGKSVFKQNEKEEPQSNVPSAVPSLPAGSRVSSLVLGPGVSAMLEKVFSL